MMTRRAYLNSLFYAGLGTLSPALRLTADLPVPDTYSVILLGDTHFDTSPQTVYHGPYLQAFKENATIPHLDEFKRNGKMWTTLCPSLIDAAGRQVTPDTRLAIQLGDLIQGDCGDPALHTTFLSDAFSRIKKAFPATPFLSVCGNHDIRGKGARGAYNAHMPATLGKELKQSVTQPTFFFRQGPDLFLFIDFNAPDAAVIREAFARHGDARHTFVVTHGSVIPWDYGSYRWFLFGTQKETDLRREMLDLFLKRNVIVLNGHLHKLGHLVYQTGKGSISQFMVNSVLTTPDLAKPLPIAESPERFGTLSKTLKPRTKGMTAEAARADYTALMDEYKPGIKRFYYAKSAGFAKLLISPNGVEATYYGGANDRPTQTFTLR
ncbi:MAG: hypothetical protein J6334_11860 [Kiritimatiellae bacterium]|nr:hypothetical protein [Kiritimatiellia bacterium]